MCGSGEDASCRWGRGFWMARKSGSELLEKRRDQGGSDARTKVEASIWTEIA
jgi:hypothetical protein